tara:strand:- start:545 stop:907 length:363 start_codon:yes stop_codon:yes gene_type:complete
MTTNKDERLTRFSPTPGDPGPQPQTPGRLGTKSVYKDKIMRIAEKNDADRLNERRDMVRNAFEKLVEGATILGTKPIFGTAANFLKEKGLPTKRPRIKARGGKMSTGGEVDIDMTTEIDV